MTVSGRCGGVRNDLRDLMVGVGLGGAAVGIEIDGVRTVQWTLTKSPTPGRRHSC